MKSKSVTIFLSLLSVLCSINLQGQKITPAPKEIIYTDQYFNLSNQMNVEVNNVSNEYVALLGQYLEMDFSTSRNKANLPSIHLRKSSGQINLTNNFLLGNEGYVLKINQEKIEIQAKEDAGIFYGIQTLRQLFNEYKQAKKIPCMIIYDKPDIPIRAWQDDISRGPIPSMETLKKQIEIMSSFKLNYFTLYTEHVFKLDKHPTIAPNDGITKAELKELSDFANKHHVTLIGNYQSFGHMEETLSNPNYNYLAENNHIISPAMEESYQFLEDVYSEIVPQYNGDYFNINCDETFGLGEGKSKSMVDSMGIDGVYSYHLNRLDQLLEKYDKKILMWGDIATSHPNIIPDLPNDITVMAWGYHAAESFDYAIEPIVKHKLDFWVAPGVNCWQNIYPNLDQAEINIYNFIRDGYKHNTSGVLNTSWDDDGLNFFNNNWHGFAWGAENSWNAPPNLSTSKSDEERKIRYDKFNAAFDLHFFGLPTNKSITSLMLEFSLFHGSKVQKLLKNTRFFEGVFPLHLDYVQKGNKAENELVLAKLDSLLSQIESLKSLATKNVSTLNYLIYSIKQTQFTVKKNLFRIAVYQYLYEGSVITKNDLEVSKNELVNELGKLKSAYIQLWNRENRPYWLDQNEMQFDVLKNSIEFIGNYVLIEPTNEVNENGRKIGIRTVFEDDPIYYSINKDTVNSSSELYNEPFYIHNDVSIKAISVNDVHQTPIQKTNLIYHKAIGKLHKLTSTYSSYHPSYDGGGKYGLVDGQVGDENNLRSGKWQGYSGQDIELELYFSENDTLNSFSMGFFQNTSSWVIFPKQVELYIKNDLNDEYQLYKTIKGSIPPEENGNIRQSYTTTLNGLHTTYLKVIARYYGKLPEWHKAGSTYESMIFADEIVIN